MKGREEGDSIKSGEAWRILDCEEGLSGVSVMPPHSRNHNQGGMDYLMAVCPSILGWLHG